MSAVYNGYHNDYRNRLPEDCTMTQFRLGNLVRHKSGGPIMMVDKEAPPFDVSEPSISCTWVEARQRKYARFRMGSLQAVYADGTSRDYSKEK
jgi:uncharacterized protein YodC (DUF2158 family)